MSITLSPSDYYLMTFVGLAVIIFVIWLVVHRRRSALEPNSLEKIEETWQQIEALVKQNQPMSWKMAILEADKILDYALKALALPGQDLGERLRVAHYNYPTVNEVWPAHKMRNRLVHETDYNITQREAARAIEQYRRTLKVLRALK
jgi:hypothetical protein